MKMPFGRSAPEISKDLVQERLKGLLARAALKAKEKPIVIVGAPEPDEQQTPKKIKFHQQRRSESRTPQPNSDGKQLDEKTKSKTHRNSLLRREVENPWKRKAETDEAGVPQLKKCKPDSSADSSSDDEQPSQKFRIKQEKKSSANKVQKEYVVSSSEASSSSTDEESDTKSSTKPGNADDDAPEQIAANEKPVEGEIEPDDAFFKPLGADTKVRRKAKVDAALPRWVKKAVAVSGKVEPCGDLVEDVDILGKSMVRLLQEDGITGLFPMQKQVIRELLDPRNVLQEFPARDICVAAPTGSGKTLAYVLPLIKLLKGRFEKAVRAVILLPTSELAQQVHGVFKHYADSYGLSAALLTGLKSHTDEIKTLLERGHSLVDVIIATPAKFLEHLRTTPGFNLRLVSHLVLDEADRMVDMILHGLIREVEDAIFWGSGSSCRCAEIEDVGRSRPAAISCCAVDAHKLPLRKLLYSATLMSDPEKLKYVNLFYPRVFHAKAKFASEKNKMFALPDSLEELKLFCEISIRPLLVWWLSVFKKMDRMIVFTRTREECHRLRVVVEHMGDCKVVDLSANMKKRQRQTALADFDKGVYNMLVCTSVLARGMDLKKVEHVLLYHVPSTAEDYVHMVGRTARANEQGKSLVLLNPAESTKLSRTLKPISNSKPKEYIWDPESLTEFHERYQDALSSAKKTIHSKQTAPEIQ